MEAWAWLVRQGFFALAPNDMYGQNHFVTRQGEAVARLDDLDAWRKAHLFLDCFDAASGATSCVRSQSRLSTFTEKRTNPKLRLAVAPGAGLPGQFASKDWTLVEEPSVLHSDVSEDIATKGYGYFQLVKG
jgi:hypothetical protein